MEEIKLKKIEEIVALVNKMPLDSQKSRLALAEQLVHEHFTANPEEAWKPEVKEEEQPSELS
jgi:hypothetical protein